MTGRHRIPSKIKPLLFTSCLNRANDRAKFDYWDQKEVIILPFLWSDDMDIETIEVFQNSHFGGTDQKSCSFWPARALEKTYVNRRLLIKFF